MAKTKKTKKLTKKDIARIKRRLRFFRLIFVALSVALVFFNFVLTISGGWDDVNYIALLIAPMMAAIALAIAFVDIYKYRASSIEAALPLAMVGVSALFYLVVSVVGAMLLTQNA